ncbi:hypothetical protein L218DRAFT_948734 [Marasmius fiardii PR-910]|nr:hypothetical protein L218DRAFT_948734 [Marasmius fiardii PR-910]
MSQASISRITLRCANKQHIFDQVVNKDRYLMEKEPKNWKQFRINPCPNRSISVHTIPVPEGGKVPHKDEEILITGDHQTRSRTQQSRPASPVKETSDQPPDKESNNPPKDPLPPREPSPPPPRRRKTTPLREQTPFAGSKGKQQEAPEEPEQLSSESESSDSNEEDMSSNITKLFESIPMLNDGSNWPLWINHLNWLIKASKMEKFKELPKERKITIEDGKQHMETDWPDPEDVETSLQKRLHTITLQNLAKLDSHLDTMILIRDQIMNRNVEILEHQFMNAIIASLPSQFISAVGARIEAHYAAGKEMTPEILMATLCAKGHNLVIQHKNSKESTHFTNDRNQSCGRGQG